MHALLYKKTINACCVCDFLLITTAHKQEDDTHAIYTNPFKKQIICLIADDLHPLAHPDSLSFQVTIRNIHPDHIGTCKLI